MKRLTDTSPEAEETWVAVHRSLSPARKWAMLDDLYRFGRELHAAGVRLRNPDATPADIRNDWIEQTLGPIDPALFRGRDSVDQPSGYTQIVHHVAAILERLGIDYALGGSLASSIHGINRQTADADISVEPFLGKEAALAAALGTDYYVNPETIRQAIADRSTFNIINTAEAFKVDVFVRKDRPFDVSLMRRRMLVAMPRASDRAIFVVSPEDVILLKLEWYRLGGEISDRQWSDIQGVLKTQRGLLDRAYLEHWSAELGVRDLHDRAWAEAQPQ